MSCVARQLGQRWAKGTCFCAWDVKGDYESTRGRTASGPLGVPGHSWDKQRMVGPARAVLRLPRPASHGSGTSRSGAEHTLIPSAQQKELCLDQQGPAPGGSRQVGSRGRSDGRQPHSAVFAAHAVTNPSLERQRRGWSIAAASYLECF